MAYFWTAEADRAGATDAYVLIRTLAPDVSPELWSACVDAHLALGGMLLLRNDAGDVFGLATYRVDDAHDAGTLLVDSFLTIELNAAGRGRAKLAAALRSVAEARQCGQIRQVIACRPTAASGASPYCNHLSFIDNQTGRPLGRSTKCSCGGLPGKSTMEMYPAT